MSEGPTIGSKVGPEAGVDGSRTHQGRLCSTPQTVLKTAEPTGTLPLPNTEQRIRFFEGIVK